MKKTSLTGNFTLSEYQLTKDELIALSDDISNVSYPEAQSSFKMSKTAIQAKILKDLKIVNTIIAQNGIIKPELEERLMIQVFKDLIELRTFFTKQEYVLQVGGKNTTRTVPLKELFNEQQGSLHAYNGKIQWSLNRIKKSVQTIEKYNESLQRLYKKLFASSPAQVAPVKNNQFIYLHSSGQKNVGAFWNGNNFAGYYNKGIQHYFIEAKKEQTIAYTLEDAFYYNRGHVYEWYLTEINRRNSEKPYDPQPISFMKKYIHTKDSIRFMSAGDYTKVAEDGTIQAVQVKRINNKKLIDYKQIQLSLIQLQALLGNISKTKFKQIVKKVFTSGDKTLDRGALDAINETVNQLFAKF